MLMVNNDAIVRANIENHEVVTPKIKAILASRIERTWDTIAVDENATISLQ